MHASLLCHFTLPLPVCSNSLTARTLATPAATPSPAQPPAGATATVTNGTKWVQVEALVVTRATQSQTASEEGDTSRGRQPTVVSTPALTAPLITTTLTLITAAPPPCWLRVEAERAGTGPRLLGTAPQRGVAGCWRGRRLLQSLQDLQERGVWKGQAGLHLLICWLETAAPTV